MVLILLYVAVEPCYVVLILLYVAVEPCYVVLILLYVAVELCYVVLILLYVAVTSCYVALLRFFCKKKTVPYPNLFNHTVTKTGEAALTQWHTFWIYPATVAAIVSIVFFILFKDKVKVFQAKENELLDTRNIKRRRE
ncbi:hypothetical protein [Psychrobacillus sp. L4]|uniref:hypothetical protein n=1 Tax=Psychrobacillus sp. L4 TaxID=3236892 RepID=UPI0036F353FE